MRHSSGVKHTKPRLKVRKELLRPIKPICFTIQEPLVFLEISSSNPGVVVDLGDYLVLQQMENTRHGSIREPYLSELVPYWRFRTPEQARLSSYKVYLKFIEYRDNEDYVGMDMARRFVYLAYSFSRRSAKYALGQKGRTEKKIPRFNKNEVMARSAEILRSVWIQIEGDPIFQKYKSDSQRRYG